MSLTGGFLGGYAILNRSGLLGAAQTSNMINTVLNLAGGSFSGLAIRLGALVPVSYTHLSGGEDCPSYGIQPHISKR